MNGRGMNGRGMNGRGMNGRRCLAMLAALASLAAASDPAERLADPAKEARARALFQQIRCVVCQNESIDDSEAALAGDLRRLVRGEIAAGASNDQVRASLVRRYGEFILLKPAFSPGNALLWLAPFAVILGGGAYFLVIARRPPAPEAELTDDELNRLDRLGKD
jgi:cytochrome c-type biogenesis protein CcmH